MQHVRSRSPTHAESKKTVRWRCRFATDLILAGTASRAPRHRRQLEPRAAGRRQRGPSAPVAVALSRRSESVPASCRITSLHGLALGTLFLLSYTGGMVELWSLRHEWATPEGVRTHLRRLSVGSWVMAITGWVTVLTGAYLVFPLYRASPPPASSDLSAYPKALMLAHPDLAVWQTIGMSWKEHIAWVAPLLATAVAFVVTRYGFHLVSQPRIRLKRRRQWPPGYCDSRASRCAREPRLPRRGSGPCVPHHRETARS